MSRFLERNQRKSVLALLLLWPGSRGATVVILLVVAIANAVFTSLASGFHSGWPARLAPASSGLALTPSAARWTRDAAGALQARRLALSRAASSGSGNAQGSSMKDLRTASSLEMVQAYRGGSSRTDVPLPSLGRTVQTIPTPKDAEKIADGVPLDEKELVAGLLKNAPAGTGASSLSRGRAIAGVGARSLHEPGSEDGSEGENALVGGPAPAKQGRVAPFAWGKAASGGAITAKDGKISPCVSGQCALHDLAEVRTFSCGGAPRGTSCPAYLAACPEGSCSSEFASRTSGAPFAGARASGAGALSMPGDPVPVDPNPQVFLQNQYSETQKLKLCESMLSAGNSAVYTANQEFSDCCEQVESSWQECRQSCPAFPLSLFTGCTSKCNTSANTGSSQCSTSYLSTYNLLASAQNGACNGMPGGVVVQTNSPWSVPFHCTPH